MRIGIDVRYLSHGLTGGVHTYVSHLVPELVRQGRGHEFILYDDTKQSLELHDLPDNVTVRHLNWRGAWSTIRNDILLQRAMAGDRIDVAHFPANYGFGPARAATVITLHDAINIMPLPEILRGVVRGRGKLGPRTLAMSVYLHYCTRLALGGASLILTDSTYAKREIVRIGGVDPARIVPILLAPTPDLHRVEDRVVLADVRRRHGVAGPFILADALKNPATLIRAWRLLPADLTRNRQIVFFSRDPHPLPIVAEAVAAGEARLLIRPSRQDLVGLYSMADVFVFPSWIEGFGLPVLEAMACGAPVIASDRGSMPEVAGDAALLVDAEDATALAWQVALVLSAPAEAERLRRRGFERAAQFSWERTAQCVLESYEGALRGSPYPAYQEAPRVRRCP